MTVIRAKIRRPSGAWPMPAPDELWAGASVMSLPSKSILPFRGVEQAVDRPQRRRLACPVGPEQGHDLAGTDLERDRPGARGCGRSRCGRVEAEERPARRPSALPGGGARAAVPVTRGSLAEVGLDDPGIATDLLGGSLGDLLAVVEHGDPIADAHHHLHVVLDQQDRDAELVADRPMSSIIWASRRVHARRRLVEQQQLGLGWRALGRSRGGAGRRTAGCGPPRSPGRGARRRPATRGPWRPRLLLAGWRGSRRAASTGVACRRECIPTITFSRAVIVLEQADVLERAADARHHHLVGPGAPEDAQPVEQPVVGRRPRDRRQECGDQEEQPDQQREREHGRRAAQHECQESETHDDQGRREPGQGSAQARRPWAIISRPPKLTVPWVGS